MLTKEENSVFFVNENVWELTTKAQRHEEYTKFFLPQRREGRKEKTSECLKSLEKRL